jgi:hypothetical protein
MRIRLKKNLSNKTAYKMLDSYKIRVNLLNWMTKGINIKILIIW